MTGGGPGTGRSADGRRGSAVRPDRVGTDAAPSLPRVRRNRSPALSFSAVGRSADAIITSNRMDHGRESSNGGAASGGKRVITSQSMAIDRRCVV